MISNTELVIYAVVSLVASVFSSIAGAGGGFIVTPLLIFLGLTPAQAIASGKFMGLSITLSNLRVTSKQKVHNWKVVGPLLVIATVIGLVSPYVITRIEGDIYQKAIGVLVLLMVPVIYLKRLGYEQKQVSEKTRKLGYAIFTVALFLQSVFGSGLGTMVNLVLVSFMGMDGLEASVSKRFTQLIAATVSLAGLLFSGLMVWKIILVGVFCNAIGGTIGAHMAIRKGNAFIMNVVITLMLLSGIALLFG